jgi:hypothetical protein
MTQFVIGIALTLLMVLVVLYVFVVRRRQTAEQAVAKLREQLREPQPGFPAGTGFVHTHRLYPLSDEMIKEAARMEGYHFEVETLSDNTRRFRFRHDPNTGAKGTRYGQ